LDKHVKVVIIKGFSHLLREYYHTLKEGLT
jgi:hypothetical protein